MARLLLSLLVLLVLMVTALGLWLTSTKSAPVAPPEAAVVLPPEAKETPSVALVTPQAPAQEERALAPTSEETLERQRWDPTNLVAIRCEVRLPAGVPADERLEVRAFRSHPHHAEPSDAPDDGEAEQAVDEFGRQQVRAKPLAVAEVDAQGHASVSVPRDIARVWLALEGRYLLDATVHKLDIHPAPDAVQPQVAFEPVLGAWISGRLVPPAGRELSVEDLGRHSLRADVNRTLGIERSSLQRGLRQRRHELDAALGFSLGALEAGSAYEVVLVTERFAAARVQSAQLQPGEHVQLDVPLRPGGTLSGHVVDARGPVAGARVRVTRDARVFGQGGFPVRSARSGADGAFRLEAVSAGKLQIEVEHEGYLELTKVQELADGEHVQGLRLELDAGAALHGVVLWPDRSPAAGATVEVEFDRAHMMGMGAFNAMRGAEGKATADAGGRFDVQGLGNGPFTVRAHHTRPAAEGTLTLRARADGQAPGATLELVLSEPIALTGQVLDSQGRPVPRFQVGLRLHSDNSMLARMAETTTRSFEDIDGRFVLPDLEPGVFSVVAASEHGQSSPTQVTLPQPPEAPVLLLTLTAQTMIRGRVLGPTGQPFPGAKVSESFDLARFQREMFDDEAPSAVSDENGRFELRGLRPGTPGVMARAEGYASSERAVVELPEGAVVEDLTLALRQGGRILGTIGDKGKPLPGATVLAQYVANPILQHSAISDASGGFVFEHVEPGNWQVMHLPSSGLGGNDPQEQIAELVNSLKLAFVEVRDGEDVEVALGSRAAEAVELSGRVRLDGKPVSGAFLTFIPDGQGALTRMATASSKADGSYSVSLPQAGRYVGSVQSLGATPGTQQNCEVNLEVPQGPTHTYDIDLPVGAISGRVRGPDGAPAAGVRVSLAVDGALMNSSFTGGNFAEVRTDEQGRYDLIWLRPGTYTVAAGGTMLGGILGESSGLGRQMQSGLRLSAGQRLERVDFQLPSPGTVTGVVRNSAGQPAERAAIFVRDSEERLLERISMLETDGSGRFTYGNLAPGEYTFSASAGTAVSPRGVSARVRSGESTQVELTLDAGTILRITLADEEGAPVDCHVVVLDEAGRQVNGVHSLSALMDAMTRGQFSSREQRVGPLPPGKYKVTAATGDGRSATRLVDLKGQPERTLNLRLRE